MPKVEIIVVKRGVDYEDVERRDIKNVLPTAVGSTFLENRLPQTFLEIIENLWKWALKTHFWRVENSKKPFVFQWFLHFL